MFQFPGTTPDMASPSVPNPPTYAQLENLAGLAGQNSPTPSQSVFPEHVVLKFNSVYYDPSYGKKYEDIDDFIESVVNGYFVGWIIGGAQNWTVATGGIYETFEDLEDGDGITIGASGKGVKFEE